jgi:hypothetical protein
MKAMYAFYFCPHLNNNFKLLNGINRNKAEIIGTDRNRTEKQRKQFLGELYI